MEANDQPQIYTVGIAEQPLAVLSPFSTIEGRNWMAERVLDPKERNYKALILLLGDGPFEGRELAEFLHRFNADVFLEHLSPPDNSSDETWEGWRCFGSIYSLVVVLGSKNFASSDQRGRALILDICSIQGGITKLSGNANLPVGFQRGQA